jgi:hypothetical protein
MNRSGFSATNQTLRIDRMANVKEGKVIIHARTPEEANGWLEKRAAYNGSSISVKISSAASKSSPTAGRLFNGCLEKVLMLKD